VRRARTCARLSRSLALSLSRLSSLVSLLALSDAPNNGTTAPSFERRREWDAQVTAYLRARRAAKPLVWIGDLNGASDATRRDLT
jgi:exonuclease III